MRNAQELIDEILERDAKWEEEYNRLRTRLIWTLLTVPLVFAVIYGVYCVYLSVSN